MFLHVGGEASIRLRELIAIVDEASRQRAADTQAFVEEARARGRFVDVSAGTVHSYVVTERCVYASPISSVALKKRADAARSDAIV